MHVPVEGQVDLVLQIEQETIEVELDAEMVTRQKMTIGRFLPDTHAPAES